MAAAVFLPLPIVVFAVRHYLENEHLVARKQYPRDEPIFVATDVEHDTTADVTGGGKVSLNVVPTLPIDRAVAHMGVPSPQRSCGVFAAGGFPKLNQA